MARRRRLVPSLSVIKTLAALGADMANINDCLEPLLTDPSIGELVFFPHQHNAFAIECAQFLLIYEHDPGRVKLLNAQLSADFDD